MTGIYKAVQLLKRRADVSPGRFVEAWTAPVDRPRPPGLLRHVHNRPATQDSPIENAPAAPFDGVDELWFESTEAAAYYFGSTFYASQWLEPRRALLTDPEPPTISGTPHLVAGNRETDGVAEGVKIIILPCRKAELSRQQFSDYWLNTHVPLALNGPGTRERLAHLEVCPSAGISLAGAADAVFDGASAIRFGSTQALQQEFASTYYHEVLAPDEPKFSDASRSFSLIVEEILIYSR